MVWMGRGRWQAADAASKRGSRIDRPRVTGPRPSGSTTADSEAVMRPRKPGRSAPGISPSVRERESIRRRGFGVLETVYARQLSYPFRAPVQYRAFGAIAVPLSGGASMLWT